MTINETAEIVKLLMSYFRNNSSASAADMTKAWHLVLEPFNYMTAREAVIMYARNDRRDYPTLPGVGSIVEEIQKAEAKKKTPATDLTLQVNKLTDYENLPMRLREYVTERQYKDILRTFKKSWRTETPISLLDVKATFETLIQKGEQA